jgi:hypothetical protein
VDSGPTAGPWVDSNAGVIRLAQALEPGKTVWLTYPVPSKSEIVPYELFPLPIAEAEAYGAHWVISLHESLRTGIENGYPKALEAWKKMIAVLEFARAGADWRFWRPVAVVAVVSDFEGPNEYLGSEFVTMAPWQQLACRIITTTQAVSTPLPDYKAVVFVGMLPESGRLLDDLMAYAESGGLLILPSQQANPSTAAEKRRGWGIFPRGRGRIAVPGEPVYDPAVLVRDTQLLVSHREDVVRIWNGGKLNTYYTASPDGDRAMVHLMNYGIRQTTVESVTLGLSEPYSSARVFTPAAIRNVQPVRTRMGIEIPVPPFSVYSAIELKR